MPLSEHLAEEFGRLSDHLRRASSSLDQMEHYMRQFERPTTASNLHDVEVFITAAQRQLADARDYAEVASD